MVTFLRIVRRRWVDRGLLDDIFPGFHSVDSDDIYWLLARPFTIFYAGYKVNGDGNVELPACSFNGTRALNADGVEELDPFSTNLRDFVVRPGLETFSISSYLTNHLFRGNKIQDNSYLNSTCFIIRVKDGQELSTNWFFTPDPTKALPGVDKGVLQEEWRYKKEFPDED